MGLDGSFVVACSEFDSHPLERLLPLDPPLDHDGPRVGVCSPLTLGHEAGDHLVFEGLVFPIAEVARGALTRWVSSFQFRPESPQVGRLDT